MFQTSLIAYLQSFDAAPFVWLMTAISMMGLTAAYAALVITLIFAVNFDKGLRVLIVLLTASCLSATLKDSFQYPRPFQVDANISALDGPSETIIDNGGARGFWLLPEAETLAATRSAARDEQEFGLPSGHVSAATAFTVALVLVFAIPHGLIWAAGWIFLMCLSRMYLGHHFLADVLLGVPVGLVSAALGLHVTRSNGSAQSLALYAIAAGLGIACFSITKLEPESAGALVAALLIAGFFAGAALPDLNGSWPVRLARVVIGFVIYIAIDRAIAAIDLDETKVTLFATGFATLGGTLLLSLLVMRLTGLLRLTA